MYAKSKVTLTAVVGAALGILIAPFAAIAANVPDALSVEWQGKKPCEKLFEDTQILVARCTLPPGTAHVCHSHPSYVYYVLSGGQGQVQRARGRSILQPALSQRLPRCRGMCLPTSVKRRCNS
jgi:hypothetical protein